MNEGGLLNREAFMNIYLIILKNIIFMKIKIEIPLNFY